MPTARDVLGPGSPLARALAGYEHREGQLAMAEAVEAALDARAPALRRGGHGHRQDARVPRPGDPERPQGRRLDGDARAPGADLRQGSAARRRGAPRRSASRSRAALMKGLVELPVPAALDEARASGDARERLSTLVAHRARGRSETETRRPRASSPTSPEDDPTRGARSQSSSETRIGAGLRVLRRVLRHAHEARGRGRADRRREPSPLLRRPRAPHREARRDGASAIPPYDAVDLRRGAPARGHRDRLLRRARLERAHRVAPARRRRASLARADALERARRSGRVRPTLEQAREAARVFFVAAARSRAAPRGEARRVLGDADVGAPSVRARARARSTRASLRARGASTEARERARRCRSSPGARRSSRDSLRSILAGARADEDGEIADLVRVDRRSTSRQRVARREPGRSRPTLRDAPLRPRAERRAARARRSRRAGDELPLREAAPRRAAGRAASSSCSSRPSTSRRARRSTCRAISPSRSDPAFEPTPRSTASPSSSAITGGGAFVLCTSTRAMRAIHARLRSRRAEADVPLLVQGEAPEAHAARALPRARPTPCSSRR